MTSFGRRPRMCVAALAAVLIASPALPSQRAEDEGRVKAAFLYNFTRFVEWPDAAFKDDAGLSVSSQLPRVSRPASEPQP